MERVSQDIKEIGRQLNELGKEVKVIAITDQTSCNPDNQQPNASQPISNISPLQHIFQRIDEITDQLVAVKLRLSTINTSASTIAEGVQQNDIVLPSPILHRRPEEQLIASTRYKSASPAPALTSITSNLLLIPTSSTVDEPPRTTAGPSSPIVTSTPTPVIDLPNRPFTLTPTSGPEFDCDYQDIETLNEVMFKQYSASPVAQQRGYFKLVVHNLPTMKAKAVHSKPGKHHATGFSCQLDDKGFVKLSKIQKTEIALPTFPLPELQANLWDYKSMKDFWEQTLNRPPREMDYVIGEPLFPDVELSPGQGLKKRHIAAVPGIGTTYAYISSGPSGSIIHGEDADLCSMNLLRSGSPKFWLIIEPDEKEHLEQCMRREFQHESSLPQQMQDCSQALRNLSRVIPPSKLDSWNIRYSLAFTNPGEAICTLPKALHQVWNHGSNYALAINVLCDTSQAIPEDYKFCNDDCLHSQAITAYHFQLRDRPVLPPPSISQRQRASAKRPDPTPHTKAIARRHPVRESASQQPQVIGSKRKMVANELQPKKLKSLPEIEFLCTVLCNKETFLRFKGLIYCCRNKWKNLERIEGTSPAAQLVHLIDVTEETSQLSQILSRVAKVRFAEIIDSGKKNRQTAESSAITQLMEELRWESTKENRDKVHTYLKEGRRWKKIQGALKGLLCLIPTPGQRIALNASCHAYYGLQETELQKLHSVLKSNQFLKALCHVGTILESSISNNDDIPEFKWERVDPDKLNRLPIPDLMPLIAKFPVITESVCDLNEWPRPECWPITWEWPRLPTWIPSSELRCQLCKDNVVAENTDMCNCIKTCLPTYQPRITNEPGKGQGVRAIDMAYIDGQILGELVGEIVQLDTHHDEWTMALTRDDLDMPIAQLWTKNIGNWVRKVNHSCGPSAGFRDMRISGFWRPMLVALRDIPIGCEITAFCGTNFLRDQGKVCRCEKCQ